MPAQATTSYVDGPHESGMFKTIRRTPGSMVIAVGRGRVEEVHDIAVATRGRQYYLVKQKSDVLKFGPWTLETVEPRDLVEITMECQIEVRDGVRFYNSGHHSGLEAMAESVMKDRAQRACRNARWNESANVQAQLQSLTDDVAPGAICRVLYVSAKPEKDTNWRYNHLKDREETIWTALGLLETQRFGFQSSQDSCSVTIMPDRCRGANQGLLTVGDERCWRSVRQWRFSPHHTGVRVDAHPPEPLVGR